MNTPSLLPVEFWPDAFVRPSLDGKAWEPTEAEDGGTAYCFLLQVYTSNEILIDTVAWEPADPTHWWLRYGNAAYLGEAAIILANLEGKPVELVGTPREYLARDGRALCILSWSADLAPIIAEAQHGLVCADPKLAERIRNTIARQRRDNVRIEVAL
jgi:hypothetical protein